MQGKDTVHSQGGSNPGPGLEVDPGPGLEVDLGHGLKVNHSRGRSRDRARTQSQSHHCALTPGMSIPTPQTTTGNPQIRE